MFKRKKKTPDNPEVQKAEDDRDVLLADVDDVVAAVKKVKDEILEQYEDAEARRTSRWSSPQS